MEMVEKYPTIIPFPVHSNDGISGDYPYNTTMYANFYTTGIPNFYVGNEDASQSPQSFITALQAETPVASVGHTAHYNFGRRQLWVFPPGKTAWNIVKRFKCG